MSSLAFIITEDSFIPDYLQGKLSEADEALKKEFEDDKYKALYFLAFRKADSDTPSLSFLSSLSIFFVDNLLRTPSLEIAREKASVEYSRDDIENLIESAPYMIGGENITGEWIMHQCMALLSVFREEIASFEGTVDLYFSSLRKDLVIPSRVYFHMIEYPGADAGFAFMATYSTIDDTGAIRHYPLKYARYEYRDDKEKLSVLIAAIKLVAKDSAFISSLVQSGDIFFPIRLSESEAYTFLKETSLYESHGIICRVPAWWRQRKASSIDVRVESKSYFSRSVVLSLVPEMIYNGIRISAAEAKELLAKNEGLYLFKGRWIEVDHDALRALLADYEKAKDSRVDIATAVKAETGIEKIEGITTELHFNSSSWLSAAISADYAVPDGFKGTLRPYQKDAFQWLCCMSGLGLGTCLADDMGLGKTIEMLAFLQKEKESGMESVLLIVPLSLLANWEHEIKRFAPSLDYLILYGKDKDSSDFPFLTISTYQMAAKNENVCSKLWDIIILDEAQAIKNAGTKQTKSIKALKKKLGIAMTGTPIENNLMNLHSILDFMNPGLFGSADAFRKLAKSSEMGKYAKLRRAISPFMLRRLKTDRSIISDLPEKIENNIMVSLTKEQIVLYREEVRKLENGFSTALGAFEGKSMILRTLLRLKQICNHPSQYTGDGGFEEKRSGKLMALREIAETLAEKRESVLVFTQFREIIPYLDDFLFGIFGKRGLTISGEDSAAKRKRCVDEFQSGGVPYMVLSLRAAGVGLNLTEASTVVHFDRWWNPAVEDQATDRAFRIGQKKNVTVYRFVSSDTIEERIDEMLSDKRTLAASVIGNGSESIISKLTPDEIIRAMRFSGDAP